MNESVSGESSSRITAIKDFCSDEKRIVWIVVSSLQERGQAFDSFKGKVVLHDYVDGVVCKPFLDCGSVQYTLFMEDRTMACTY